MVHPAVGLLWLQVGPVGLPDSSSGPRGALEGDSEMTKFVTHRGRRFRVVTRGKVREGDMVFVSGLSWQPACGAVGMRVGSESDGMGWKTHRPVAARGKRGQGRKAR